MFEYEKVFFVTIRKGIAVCKGNNLIAYFEALETYFTTDLSINWLVLKWGLAGKIEKLPLYHYGMSAVHQIKYVELFNNRI